MKTRRPSSNAANSSSQCINQLGLLAPLPHELVMLIFQFLIATPRDIAPLELVNKTMFASIVNNTELSYNAWLLFAQRVGLHKALQETIGKAATKQPLVLRSELKQLYLNLLPVWLEMKIALVYVFCVFVKLYKNLARNFIKSFPPKFCCLNKHLVDQLVQVKQRFMCEL